MPSPSQPSSHAAPSRSQQNAQASAALAVLLASGLPVPAMAGYAAAILAPLGVTGAAARAALSLSGSGLMVRGPVKSLTGSAARSERAAEATHRAAYVMAAAQRVQDRLNGGATLSDAVKAERGNFQAHLDATRRRREAASTVDQAARSHGALLGWYAVMDSATTPECRAANGSNFPAGSRPVIGWPGTVHPRCRCRPGAPHTGAGMVDAAVAATVGRRAVA